MTDLFTSWEIALAFFALVQIADVATTVFFLRRGVSEGNPVIRFFMDHAGNVGWIAFKLIVAGLIAWSLYSYSLIWVLWLVSAGYVGVVIWNTRAGRS